MRTIIVGDIHGCYKEFITLLKKVHYKKKKDRLILLGDLMDRGPLSYEMFQWAMRWKKENPDSFYLVRGNHEQMIVEQAKELDTRLIWRVVGKTATLRSFARHKVRLESTIPWIVDHMPLYYEKDGIRCVHASLIEEEFDQNAVEVLVKDHSQSKKNLYGGKFTIIGHTPLELPVYYNGSGEAGEQLCYGEWKPLPDQGTICIDTGCVFGNGLTCMIVEDGKYLLEHVKSEKQYMENNAHFYVSIIRKFCALPIVRNFCSGSNSR